LCSTQFLLAALLCSSLVSDIAPLSPLLVEQVQNAEVERLASRVASELAPQSYYIALNLHNNAPILGQLSDQLLLLTRALGSSRVFVSIFENGSSDSTHAHLGALSRLLTQHRVRHHVNSVVGSWKSLCSHLSSLSVQDACVGCTSLSLRSCPANVRIPVMALIRNLALLPLFNVSDIFALNAKVAAAAATSAVRSSGLGIPPLADDSLYVAGHLGFTLPTTVVFLNDVLLYANDVIELISTAGGAYDAACAMDFDVLQLYDTWVSRDLNGATLSGWYPFVRESLAQARLIAGEPFRVYSCWNGAVALPAAAFTQGGLLFRSWREGEARSLHPDADTRLTWSDRCPASECHLVCKDLWAMGRSRIYMNPRVRLVYNYATETKQRVLMPILNALIFRWFNRIEHGRYALRGKRQLIGSAATPEHCVTNCTVTGLLSIQPPVRSSCGLTEDDDLDGRS
jgi:hypothetical protein